MHKVQIAPGCGSFTFVIDAVTSSPKTNTVLIETAKPLATRASNAGVPTRFAAIARSRFALLHQIQLKFQALRLQVY